MYKFYAQMDSKKDNTFDIEYLHSMLSLREFLKFGYQQKLTPKLLTPDELVQVFKYVLSDSQDKANESNDKKSIANRSSAMVDYDYFKKAIVRISIIAQEKLGGNNEDLLKSKLEAENKQNQQLEAQKRQAADKFKKKDQKSKAEMDQLRKQFEAE
jgi:hypothetical protein